MGKFYLLLFGLFISSFSFSQENINLDQMLANSGQYTAKNIDTRVLYQRSVMIADIPHFNQNDRNVANYHYFKQALQEMYISSNQLQYFSHKILEEKILPESQYPNMVAVGIMNTELELLNYDEENPNNSNNGFTFTGTALIPIDGKTQFVPFQNSIISPLKESLIGSSFIFRFRNDLYLNNSTKNIKDLTVDLGDGMVRNIIVNGVFYNSDVSLTVSESKTLKQTYNITYYDNTTLTTYSEIFLKKDLSTTAKSSISNTLDFEQEAETDLAFQGYDEPQALRGKFDYRIYYTDSEKKLKKPVIIVDGFDPGDNRKIENGDYPNPNDPKNKTSIYELMKYTNEYGENRYLVSNLKDAGYDVIIVNFPSNKVIKPWVPKIFGITPKSGYVDGGADFIERNAFVFVSLIRELNKQLTQNGSNEKIVVMGPSMGGQITRYALAYMEKKLSETGDQQKWNHNTRLWVSLDSPHHGANIPIGLQSVIYLMQKWGLADAENFYYDQLKSPAAKQMLINQHEPGSSYHTINDSYMNGRTISQGFSENKGSPFYQQYYNNLYSNGLSYSKGFPVNLRKVSIFNGSVTGEKVGNSFSENTLNVRGFLNYWVLFWPIKIHAFSLETYTLPSFNSNSRLARFKIAWWDRTVVGSNYDNRGNLDTMAGGYFDGYDQVAKPLMGIADKYSWINIFTYLLINTTYDMQLRENKKIHTFMPVFSTIGMKNPNQYWDQNLSRNLVCTNETYFDSYYGETYNTDHTYLTNGAVKWLQKELGDKTNPPYPQPPSYVIPANQLIEGKTLLCLNETETFTFNSCGFPAVPNLSVTNGSVISQSSNSITVKATNNGLMKITASFPNSSIAPIVKKVWVGNPSVYYELNPTGNYVYYTLKSTNPEVTLQEQGITSITCSTISNTGGSISSNCESGLAHGPSYNWYIERKIIATNNCGTYETIEAITPPAPDPCDGYRIVKTNNSKNNYRIIDPCSGSNRTMDDKKFENIKIQIVDAKGNISFETTNLEFDVSRLLTGVYYARIIKNNNLVYSQTLIKE